MASGTAPPLELAFRPPCLPPGRALTLGFPSQMTRENLGSWAALAPRMPDVWPLGTQPTNSGRSMYSIRTEHTRSEITGTSLIAAVYPEPYFFGAPSTTFHPKETSNEL